MDLDSIADIATLSTLLASRGYSAEDIEGILQANFLRFLRENLG